MATFTITLKDVIKVTGGTTAIVDNVRKLTGGNIGLQSYPIFDEAYRDHLTGRIIDHFWNMEIGQESISLWQLAMRRKMNEIMPYYNKLYLTERIDYQALSTVSLTTTGIGNAVQASDSTGASDSSGVSGGMSRAVSSETPQTMLSGSADYATAANDVRSTSDTESTGSTTSNDNTTSDTTNEQNTNGYQGAASDLIMRYRDSLINIDLMIIGELEIDMFMLVWSNGDSYTNLGDY